MIYILALLAVCLGAWIWHVRRSFVPLAAPAADTAPQAAPEVRMEDGFAIAQDRRRHADDIDEDAVRLVRKLGIVRQALNEDIAALKRMRAEADAAEAEATEMRKLKREADELATARLAELRAALEANVHATNRIAELGDVIDVRDGELSVSREAYLELQADHQRAQQTAAENLAEIARMGICLNEARQDVARLEQALQEREEELAVQARQIDALQAAGVARQQQIETLQAQIATLIGRFEHARRESHDIIAKLREGQQHMNERAEKQESDSDIMRRHIVEVERARDRLLGQVGQLRAENAGLRAETQVKVRDLESLNSELAANIAVLERMLAGTRTIRAQPAPARAHLRLIAEAKKAPGRAMGAEPCSQRASVGPRLSKWYQIQKSFPQNEPPNAGKGFSALARQLVYFEFLGRDSNHDRTEPAI